MGQQDETPNIVLLFSDQHAQKISGCYGDAIAETPNIDRLAASGVVFDNAYCPSPLCTPSRMSMLTGRTPSDQQCWTLQDMLPSDCPTWVHALGAAGYQNILAGRMHSIGPDQLRGYEKRFGGEAGPNWLGVKRQDLGILAGAQAPGRVSLTNSGVGQCGYQVNDASNTQHAVDTVEWLAKEGYGKRGKPFSLTVGLGLPHCPFVAAEEDYRVFEGRVPPPKLGRAANEHPWINWWIKRCDIENPDPADVERTRTAYYGLLRRVDSFFGRVLDALDRKGLMGNTLVIYCSDHGEHLGERGLWWKNTMFDESTKVPLIMSWPGVLPAGERRSQVVNLTDVTATMVDAANAPALPRCQGNSLLPVARDPKAPWSDETYSEYVTDGHVDWAGGRSCQQRMIRSGRYKLVYYHAMAPTLFDLEADPDEVNDLAADPEYAHVVDTLLQKVLDGWDPVEIERLVAVKRKEKELLSAWGAATNPTSTYCIPITAEDSWLGEKPAHA